LVDAVVLGAYFVIVITIGVVSSRRVKSMDDYYMGGRRFGKVMMTMYAFGAGTHADTAVGVVSQSYRLGMAGIWYQWLQIFNTPLYWLLAVVFRRARCLTTADLYEMRYGRSLGTLFGFMGVAINLSYMGLMLLGSGRLVEALSGHRVTLGWAIALMLGSFVFYALIGGLVATVWNDFFQGVLTIVMSFLLIPFVLNAIGGVSGFQQRVPNAGALFSLTSPGEIGLFWIISTAINQMFSLVAQPHIMSNMAAGKSELDNRIGFTAGVSLKRVCTVAWALVGVLALGLYQKTGVAPDHVFGALIHDLLPAGFAGLMVACIMASVMDNGAVYLITTSALFTRNLMRVVRKDAAGDRRELLISRIFSVVFAACSVALAYAFEDVPSGLRFLWGLTPLIGIAFWLGLWWRRANRYGAWASFLAASISWIIGVTAFGWSGNQALPKLIALNLGTGLVAGAVVSLLTPPEPEDRLDRFYVTINTPIGEELTLPTGAIVSEGAA